MAQDTTEKLKKEKDMITSELADAAYTASLICELDPTAVRRARRAAAKRGWRVEIDRGMIHLNNRGGLMLIDDRNIVIEGVNFDLTPDQVIARCSGTSDA